MTKRKLCCFCRKQLKDGEANNVKPIRERGICCDECNANIVVPYRFLMASAATVHTID